MGGVEGAEGVGCREGVSPLHWGGSGEGAAPRQWGVLTPQPSLGTPLMTMSTSDTQTFLYFDLIFVPCLVGSGTLMPFQMSTATSKPVYFPQNPEWSYPSLGLDYHVHEHSTHP